MTGRVAYNKGKPLGYIPKMAFKKGHKPHNFKGKIVRTHGYISVFAPDHPYRDNKNHILEHRLVMETHLGRLLAPMEVVHHKNGVKDDNRIENLELFISHSEHMRIHKNNKKHV